MPSLFPPHIADYIPKETPQFDAIGTTFIVDFKGSSAVEATDTAPPKLHISLSPVPKSPVASEGNNETFISPEHRRNYAPLFYDAEEYSIHSDHVFKGRFQEDSNIIIDKYHGHPITSSPTLAHKDQHSPLRLSQLYDEESDLLPPVNIDGIQKLLELARAICSLIGVEEIGSDDYVDPGPIGPDSSPPRTSVVEFSSLPVLTRSCSPASGCELEHDTGIRRPSSTLHDLNMPTEPDSPKVLASDPPPFTPQSRRVSVTAEHQSIRNNPSAPVSPESTPVVRSTIDFVFTAPQVLTSPERQDINDRSISRRKKPRRSYSNKGRLSSIPKAEQCKENIAQGHDNSKYKIERLLAKRTRRGIQEYHVKWFGYPLSQATWEPEKNLREDMEEGESDDREWIALLETLPKKRRKS
ncbi:hypothetical protein BDD12DRAFT_933151 [Trichophaea hybrida]|nr:hypothetical protein BDD12DRAFT_933151 [Trichophaea hybrida]